MYIDSLDGFEQATELEYGWAHDGTSEVLGFLIDCTDGHTYLVFAPDRNCLTHMAAYSRILRMVKTRMSDHEYDPIRKCIKPAFSSEYDDGFGDHKVFCAPPSEMGKIYRVK